MRIEIAAPLVLVATATIASGGTIDGQTSREADRSILSLLRSRGEVTVDSAVTDVLDETNYLVRAGRRVEAWTLATDSVGEQFRIDLESEQFDPYLYVVGPDIGAALAETGEDGNVLTNDDGGEGLNSRICFQAPQAASYHIVVSALYANTGEYTLRVRRGCDDVGESGGDGRGEQGFLDSLAAVSGTGFDPWGAAPVDALRPGVIRRSVLSPSSSTDDNGNAIEVWALSVDTAQRLYIDIFSDEFSPNVRVVSANGLSGGYTASRDGWFWVVPTQDDPGVVNYTEGATVCLLAGPRDDFRVIATSASTMNDEVYGLLVSEDPDGVRCSSGRASTQHYYELLLQLSEGGRRIHVGESRSGERFTSVEKMDPVLPTPIQPWLITGVVSEEWITIDIQSEAFVPRVSVLGDGVEDIVSREGVCGQRINIRASRNGTYPVLVQSWRSEEEEQSGEFELSVSRGRLALDDMTQCEISSPEEDLQLASERVLQIGTEVGGELTPQEPRVTWQLQGIEGQTVVIAVESDSFDTYLEVYGPGLIGGVWDDDGGPNGNSRLVLQFPEDGEFEVTVSSFLTETGEYRLRVVRRMSPGR